MCNYRCLLACAFLFVISESFVVSSIQAEPQSQIAVQNNDERIGEANDLIAYIITGDSKYVASNSLQIDDQESAFYALLRLGADSDVIWIKASALIIYMLERPSEFVDVLYINGDLDNPSSSWFQRLAMMNKGFFVPRNEPAYVNRLRRLQQAVREYVLSHPQLMGRGVNDPAYSKPVYSGSGLPVEKDLVVIVGLRCWLEAAVDPRNNPTLRQHILLMLVRQSRAIGRQFSGTIHDERVIRPNLTSFSDLELFVAILRETMKSEPFRSAFVWDVNGLDNHYARKWNAGKDDVKYETYVNGFSGFAFSRNAYAWPKLLQDVAAMDDVSPDTSQNLLDIAGRFDESMHWFDGRIRDKAIAFLEERIESFGDNPAVEKSLAERCLAELREAGKNECITSIYQNYYYDAWSSNYSWPSLADFIVPPKQPPVYY